MLARILVSREIVAIGGSRSGIHRSVHGRSRDIGVRRLRRLGVIRLQWRDRRRRRACVAAICVARPFGFPALGSGYRGGRRGPGRHGLRRRRSRAWLDSRHLVDSLWWSGRVVVEQRHETAGFALGGTGCHRWRETWGRWLNVYWGGHVSVLAGCLHWPRDGSERPLGS